MPIPAGVLAAIISAVGGLASASVNANKPPEAQPLPGDKNLGQGFPMDSKSSLAAMQTGQKGPGTVADAFPQAGAAQPPQGGATGQQVDPRILAFLKQLGGF